MPKFGKILLVFLVGIAILLIGCESNLRLVKRDFRDSRVAGAFASSVAYQYLQLRRILTKSDLEGSSIAVAFHVARQPAPTYLKRMELGGFSLSILKPIVFNIDIKNNPFKVQAAYEALVLLNGMPLDADLFQLGDQLSNVLVSAIRQQESQSDPEEVFAAKEVLSMYVARKLGEAKLLEGMLLVPGQNTQWRNDLATVRVVLAACAQRVIEVPAPAWSALVRGFGPKWLHREGAVGWDAALIGTVQASNTSEDCKKLAIRFESMINFSIKE